MSEFGKLFKKKKAPHQDIAAKREKEVGRDLSALDTASFDLDNDNKKIFGVVAVTKDCLLCLHFCEGEPCQASKTVEINLQDIEKLTMRSEFGVYVMEAEKKDGETVVLGRASFKKGKPLVKFFKRAELYLTDKEVYDRRKDEPWQDGPNGKKVDKFKTFKRMMSMATPHRGTIILVTAIYIVTMFVSLIEPYINRIMVDDFINNAGAAELAKSEPAKVLVPFLLTVLMLLGAYIITWVIGLVRNLIMMNMGLKIVVDLRTKLFDKVEAMSLGRVSQKTTGELMNRISNDATVMQNFLNSWVPNFLGQVLLLIAVSVVLIRVDPLLLPIFVVPIGVTLPAIALFHRKIHKIYGKQWEATSKSGAVLHDILSGIRVVKAFGTEERESSRYCEAAGKERDLAIRNEILFAKLQPFIRFGLLLGNFIILYYTGDKILGGALTVGEAAMISSYINIVYGPMRWLANFPTHFNRMLTSASRVFEVLDEEIDIDDKEDAIDREIEGTVTFENVCFGYDETQQVLKDINLTIKPGEMVGLVGRSGVGKSTLINLIMRLYEVESGSVKIDGIDIRDYSQECLRSQIGVVLQETILFSGSLYDNVVYAKENATRKEVLAASRAAGVHEFAIKLPDGYNTVIGEKGYTLSGGERQRVAIARAILRNPRILILDEATASLDTEIEKQIQEAIEVLIKDRTTVAIAHRLSTLRNAAKIIVLDKGTVAEVGSHEELLRKKGIYYGLVMAQRETAR